jgi:hypothetical protein
MPARARPTRQARGAITTLFASRVVAFFSPVGAHASACNHRFVRRGKFEMFFSHKAVHSIHIQFLRRLSLAVNDVQLTIVCNRCERIGTTADTRR